MLKDTHDYIPMNMIGLSQTSREIIEDSDILTLPVLLINPTRKVYLEATCRS